MVNQLPQELNDNQRREKHCWRQRLNWRRKILLARKLAGEITPADLEQNSKARYWQAKIDASQGRPSIDLCAR
ncbi:hypothetical protein EH63_18155 [Escherichia coli]|nr:hypothetical protein EH63_18155 [Escherichia coli]